MKLQATFLLFATVIQAFQPISVGGRRPFALSFSVAQEEIETLKLQDIQSELRERGVLYQDGLDKDGLIFRLRAAREEGEFAPAKAETVNVTKVPIVDSEERLEELRSKDLINLKLMCSKRSIRYAPFEDKEDFVQAIWNDMEEGLRYSVSETLRPGKAAVLTGDQLDQEMTSSATPILVDVYATWCGPCKLVAPEMDKVAAELGEQVRVVKLDSDKYADWAGRYKVQGLPTTFVMLNGQVQERLVGAFTKDKYLELLQPSLQQCKTNVQ